MICQTTALQMLQIAQTQLEGPLPTVFVGSGPNDLNKLSCNPAKAPVSQYLYMAELEK